MAALNGKVEGAVADKLVGLYTIKQNSELTDKLKLVGEEFASTPVALAFAKGQKKQLRIKFKEALVTFQKSNDYTEIFNKWFGIKSK
jgi:ABC-type amino acid transport substrate-binding protein